MEKENMTRRSQVKVFSFAIVILIILTTAIFAFVFPNQQSSVRGQKVFNPGGVSVRGQAGDLWADVVLGKIDFNQSGPNQVVPFKVFNPGGVIVDRTIRPNRVYVWDGGNSRILGYSSLGVCANNAAIACTAHSDCAGSSCIFTPNKPADLVLGQPSGYDYSACNNDGNMENYPNRKPASANTLCSLPPWAYSPLEAGSFVSMDIDAESNLYVPDYYNNRVLKFNNPFATDTVADEVWGQDDFTGHKCNKTSDDFHYGFKANPTESSLCLGWGTFVGGVDIDANGHMWVADAGNNRVVRFPKQEDGTIAKSADVVFGQPDFQTNLPGFGPNQMNQPAAVRVDPNTGWVYLADYYLDSEPNFSDRNSRMLVFKPPFTNGMDYSALFGSQFKRPASIEFDPGGEGIWISDLSNYMVELWDYEGTAVKKVLFKDTYQPNGQCGPSSSVSCSNLKPDGSCNYNMCDVRGSLGIDSDNNLFITSSEFNQDTWRFEAPIPTPVAGKVYGNSYQLHYPPDGRNYRSANGPFSPRGMVIKNNQFILSDGYKVVFWNDLTSLTNGKPADGFIGVSSFQDRDPLAIQRIAADDQGHLLVARKATIDLYQLPLTSAEQPTQRGIISFENPLPVLGGGTISWGFDDVFSGHDIDPTGTYLWLAQPGKNRLIRVRNPFTNPVVDVILGQTDTKGSYCNRIQDNDTGGDPPGQTPNTICVAGAVKLDREGNVWVSDSSLEFHGNKRILKFNANQFMSLSTAVYAPNADLVSPRVAAWEMAFDAFNRMAVGYSGIVEENPFPGLYVNPTESLLTSKEPDVRLKDFFSHGYSSAFDNNNNLYIADLNRGRILIYLDPLRDYPTPPPFPVTITMIATEDTFITSSSPTTTKGNETYLRISSSPDRRALVRFDASAIPAGATILSATFKLYNKKGSAVAGAVYRVNGSWSESTTHYNNAPAMGEKIADFPNPVTVNTWKEAEVTNAVDPGGNVDFYLATSVSDGADYQSSEGKTEKPTLAIIYLNGTPPTKVASFYPAADTFVRSDSPNNTSGGTASKLTVDGSPIKVSYLKFDLSSLAGKTVTNVKLKFRVSGSSAHTQTIKFVSDTSWGEKTMTYNNRPSLSTLLNSLTNGKSNIWYELPITSPEVISQTGFLLSIGIDSSESNDLQINSRESSYDPVLIVTYY